MHMNPLFYISPGKQEMMKNVFIKFTFHFEKSRLNNDVSSALSRYGGGVTVTVMSSHFADWYLPIWLVLICRRRGWAELRLRAEVKWKQVEVSRQATLQYSQLSLPSVHSVTFLKKKNFYSIK